MNRDDARNLLRLANDHLLDAMSEDTIETLLDDYGAIYGFSDGSRRDPQRVKARSTDPSTSREAWLKNRPKAESQRGLILAVIEDAEAGLTAEQVHEMLPQLPLNSVSTRISELKQGGWIRTEGTRPTRQGADAEVLLASEPNDVGAPASNGEPNHESEPQTSGEPETTREPRTASDPPGEAVPLFEQPEQEKKPSNAIGGEWDK